MNARPDWWPKPRRVAVVVDTPGWFDRHAEVLVEEIGRQGDRATFARGYHDFDAVDIAFYLSCLKIVPPEGLAKARVNLVAHASDLPKGRGFSPIVWQILEGRREIPLRLIHAAEPVDSGDIVLSDSITFEGHELNDELRDTLGKRIIDLENRLSVLSARQQELEYQDFGHLPFQQAAQLIEMGAAVEDIIKSCGLSRSEAELVNLLHGSKSGSRIRA